MSASDKLLRRGEMMKDTYPARVHDALGHTGRTRRVEDPDRVREGHLHELEWPTVATREEFGQRGARSFALSIHRAITTM